MGDHSVGSDLRRQGPRLPRAPEDRFECAFYGDAVKGSTCVARQRDRLASQQQGLTYCIGGKCKQGPEVAQALGEDGAHLAGRVPPRRTAGAETKPAERLKLGELLHREGERRPPEVPSAVMTELARTGPSPQAAASEARLAEARAFAPVVAAPPRPAQQPPPAAPARAAPPPPAAPPTPAPVAPAPEKMMAPAKTEAPPKAEPGPCSAPINPPCTEPGTREGGRCGGHYQQKWRDERDGGTWKPRPLGRRPAPKVDQAQDKPSAPAKPGPKAPAKPAQKPKVVARARPAAKTANGRAQPHRTLAKGKAPLLPVDLNALGDAELAALVVAGLAQVRARREQVQEEARAKVELFDGVIKAAVEVNHG
jgi:hypothetical protein